MRAPPTGKMGSIQVYQGFDVFAPEGPVRWFCRTITPRRSMPRLPAVKRFVSNTGVRIYRIACQAFAGLTVRAYLLLGAGPPTLIDTGSGRDHSTEQLLAGLDAVRTEFGESIGVGDVERILITHGHVDHVGGVADLLPHTDAMVGIHPLDARVLTAFRQRSVLGNRRRLAFFRRAGVHPGLIEKLNAAYAIPGQKTDPVPVALALDDGVQLDGLQIIHTPGHAPGHVCIAVGDVLLAGDHILARTIPQLWPETTAPYNGLGHYLESLEKIRRAGPFTIVLAGHEPPVDDIPHRIEQIENAHRRRLGRVVDAVAEAQGPLTIADVTRRLYPNISGFYLVLALCDVGARVEYLHQRGRLDVANLDEIENEPDPAFQYVGMSD